MNTKNTDLLIECALLCAGEEDDWSSRELGQIHILKYVYLGDLAYAKQNEGRTFSEAGWRFFHFGPWCAEVQNRIRPAVQHAEAIVKTYSSAQEKDIERYVLRNRPLLQDIERQLPLMVFLAIKRAVHRFSNDTPRLLHYVYQTPPMLNAAPREALNFRYAVPEDTASEEMSAPPEEKISVKEQKRRHAKLEDKRVRFADRVRQIREREPASPKRLPRYDDTFFEGIEWLDSLAGYPLAGIVS